nr:MAG TPA: hypothetical protein [Caudoviricetes sp.]
MLACVIIVVNFLVNFSKICIRFYRCLCTKTCIYTC